MSIPGDLWGLSGAKVFTWGFVEVTMGIGDWNSLGSTYPCIKEVFGKRPRGRGQWISDRLTGNVGDDECRQLWQRTFFLSHLLCAF